METCIACVTDLAFSYLEVQQWMEKGWVCSGIVQHFLHHRGSLRISVPADRYGGDFSIPVKM